MHVTHLPYCFFDGRVVPIDQFAAVIAQLGVTDMKHAIQYALTYPDRKENCMAPLDFKKLNRLTFEEPDLERFPCLNLAYEAIKIGGTMPTALNAANEVAVQAFLDGKIGLGEIAIINRSVMSEHKSRDVANLETILETDKWARTRAIMKLSKSASASEV